MGNTYRRRDMKGWRRFQKAMEVSSSRVARKRRKREDDVEQMARTGFRKWRGEKLSFGTLVRQLEG